MTTRTALLLTLVEANRPSPFTPNTRQAIPVIRRSVAIAAYTSPELAWFRSPIGANR